MSTYEDRSRRPRRDHEYSRNFARAVLVLAMITAEIVGVWMFVRGHWLLVWPVMIAISYSATVAVSWIEERRMQPEWPC